MRRVGLRRLAPAPAAADTAAASPTEGPPAEEGGGAPASRSAALPARPWPSTDRLARNSDPLGRIRHARAAYPGAHATGSTGATGRTRRPGRTGGPRWRRGPIPRRVSPDGRIGRIARRRRRVIVVRVIGAVGGRDRARCRLCRDSCAARVRGLAPGPVLEGRADRERARQAVRLLVSDGSRCRRRLGETPVAMVRARRTSIAVVAESDERTGRGTVHAGQPSLSHPRDDTRPVGLETPHCLSSGRDACSRLASRGGRLVGGSPD